MNQSRRGFVVALALAGAVFGVWALKNAREIARLHHDLQLTDRDAVAPAKADRGATDLTRELSILRTDVRQLTADLEARQQSLARRMAGRTLEPVVAKGGSGSWVDLGRDTPAHTFRSALRAIDSGDVDALGRSIALDDAAQAEADRLWAGLPVDVRAHYESTLDLVASITAAETQVSFSAVEATRESPSGEDETAVTFAMHPNSTDTTARKATLHFRRCADGWHLLVPAKVIEGYRYLMVNASVQAMRGPP